MFDRHPRYLNYVYVYVCIYICVCVSHAVIPPPSVTTANHVK